MAVCLNAVLDYVLIFGGGGGGGGGGIGPFPEMGIRGAAIGTVAAMSLIVLLYAFVIWKEAAADGFHFLQNRKFDLSLIWRMMRFGFPTGVQIFADGAGFTFGHYRGWKIRHIRIGSHKPGIQFELACLCADDWFRDSGLYVGGTSHW